MKYDIVLYNSDTSFFGENNIIKAEGDNFSAAVSSAVKNGKEKYIIILNGSELREDTIEKIGGYIEKWGEDTDIFELRQRPYEQQHLIEPRTLETDVISTDAFVISRKAFEKLGGFDERFSVLKDIDFSWRARANCLKMKFCPLAQVNTSLSINLAESYIYGAYEKLMLAYKFGDKDVIYHQNEVYKNTVRNPQHFDGVRKKLLKLYIEHYAKSGSYKKFRKSNSDINWDKIIDFSDDFGVQRGVVKVEDLKTKPLVSVVVRTHRRKESLRRTLESLRNQTYDNFEIVIVEDGENTAEEMVKKDFSDLDINYYATINNVGRGRAGNVGIERAKGELVSFLDDDDYYYPDFIETFVAEFEKNPDADVAVCGDISFACNVVSYDPYEFTTEEIFPVIFDHITLMDMCVLCRVPMACGMFRRAMYDKFGGMREDIGGDEDWVMWLKYMAYGNRISKYKTDIPRALSLFGFPADKEVAKKREENYRVFDKIMLYDENLVFKVHGEEIKQCEEYVKADIEHIKAIDAVEEFKKGLRIFDIEKLEYNPEGENTVTAKQLNNYYYWLVEEYLK